MRHDAGDEDPRAGATAGPKRGQTERVAEAALRELMKTCMLGAARALRRRRAHVEVEAPIICPLCSGRLSYEQVLTPPTSPSGRGWNEAYRYGCERCTFESNTGPIWSSGNDMTLHEYLCGNGGGDPLRDDALSQRFARDYESRIYFALDVIRRCADERGVDSSMAAEEALEAGLLQHVDIVTDVELEHIKAAIAAVAKEREPS